MEKIIFEVLDNSMLYGDLENLSHQNVMDFDSSDDGRELSDYDFSTDDFDRNWDGSESANNPSWLHQSRLLAYRYRHIRHVYEDACRSMKTVLSQSLIRKWHDLFESLDQYALGWISVATLLLQSTRQNKHSINVIVTTTALCPALVKVLLFNLSEFFSSDCIYSSQPA
eukprot:Ihof_evm1s1450 gene=Ihof_evmTU1s1450